MAIFVVLVSGCIRIPEQNWTVSHRSHIETRRQSADCTAAALGQSLPDRMGPGRTVRTPELNPDGFRLVSWNVLKGQKRGWAEDFQKFISKADILSLQEAYLTAGLKKMLVREEYNWDMTTAFEYRQIGAGVLTAARTAPNFACSFRATEPITRIPKSVLITRYPMSGTERELLVANIHAINYSLGLSAFNKQIEHLLQHIETSGCTFNRNGTVHGGRDASAHIRKKYDHTKRWINSAQTCLCLCVSVAVKNT